MNDFWRGVRVWRRFQQQWRIPCEATALDGAVEAAQKRVD